MANIQILVGAGFTEVHGDPKNIEISETSESKQDAGTRSQDQSLEGLSFSFDTVNDSHTRQGDKTRSAVVLSELAKNNPEEFLKLLSKVFDDGKINLRDPIFENNAELIGLVKARCVPAESTQVIKFIDLLARSSEHDGVSDDSGFRMEFDWNQQDIMLDEDRTAHVVKYSYKQTATLEFNEKNIIITHENGNILTLSATKNPYQGSVSYTVVNDEAKNLGEAWNHDLKDIVVMFLTTGKLDTENHDDGNVWRIPSDAETKTSESINFLKDVAEGVKAREEAQSKQERESEAGEETGGSDVTSTQTESAEFGNGANVITEVSSYTVGEAYVQVVDSLGPLLVSKKVASPTTEILAPEATDTPQPSTASQSSDTTPSSSESEAKSVTYERGTPIKDVKLKYPKAKKADYPKYSEHTSITSVSQIITKVKEAGGQALVEIRLQKSEETGHPKDGFRTKIIDLLGVTTVTDTNIAPEKLAPWSSIADYKLKGGKTPGTSDCLAILREGSDGKFYVCMREFAFKAADGKEDDHQKYIGDPNRSTTNKVFLPFNKKEDALSCIAYLSDDMTNIPALLQELIPDLKKIDYENLVKPSDHHNQNLHFFEDAPS